LSDWHDEFEREAQGFDASRADADRAGAAGTGPRPGPAVPGGDSILRVMDPAEAYRLEELEARTGLAAVPLMARLTRLEVDGWIERAEGGRFVKVSRNVLR
ncbi:MAG: hypothetical protein MUF60_08940, partial [Vicinamibacterales bacterium]|nr:hypothetical protein [Vicinamibacterales bacterium]